MRARLVVIGQAPGQQARQSGFIHDDHVVETLQTNRADDPLGIRVLPQGPRRGEHLVDAHPGRRWSDPRERVITIANEIPRDLVPGADGGKVNVFKKNGILGRHSGRQKSVGYCRSPRPVDVRRTFSAVARRVLSALGLTSKCKPPNR